MQQALEMVRQELGPEASVLHTREVGAGMVSRLLGQRKIEVVASGAEQVPARLEAATLAPMEVVPVRRDFAQDEPASGEAILPAHEECDYRAKYRADLGQELSEQIGSLHSMVEQLCAGASQASEGQVLGGTVPGALFEAFTSLIEADVNEETARELVDTLQADGLGESLGGFGVADEGIQQRLLELVKSQITTAGPIQITPGARRLVALVGPTGVGKTTTIAKLAANYRLLEKKRVGLITVDTYRVAAVEQLRTYADIIDLPMEVVATPREMREAVARMEDLDLVLLDTAGRSPRDEVQIQELKSMLGEAQADEVHLVLSSTAAPKSLVETAQRFAKVGATSLLLTKLDEAMSLGHLLTLLRNCPLPVSYLTNGQNVPDDIEVADAGRLAESLLSVASEI